jgi:hypothetical protein
VTQNATAKHRGTSTRSQNLFAFEVRGISMNDVKVTGSTGTPGAYNGPGLPGGAGGPGTAINSGNVDPTNSAEGTGGPGGAGGVASKTIAFASGDYATARAYQTGGAGGMLWVMS